MTKLSWIVTLCLILVAFGLRIHQFEARTPFDWDQNRDYEEVRKIVAGEHTALGPIAKGASGGFYLGSLYYYILVPSYQLFQSDLSALPLTSILIDTVVVALIYLFFRKGMGEGSAFALATLWMCSWFLIEWSRVSWNVALVPIWSLLAIYALHQSISAQSKRAFYFLAIIAGLSVHIHVSTIPIIPLLLIFLFKRFKFTRSTWLKALGISLIPATPLIYHDLTHSFANLHLVKDYLTFRSNLDASWLEIMSLTVTRLGKVVSGIIASVFRSNLVLGVVALALALRAVFTKNLIIILSGAFVLATSFLIIILRDPNFPEYYFAPSYLAILALLIDLLFSVFKKINLAYLTLIIIIIINLGAYQTESVSLSLGAKKEIVASLAKETPPLDITYSFDPGRDGGLRYLVEQSVKLDSNSKARYILTDKLNTPLYIDGELARDIGEVGNIRLGLYIVQ